MDTEYARRQMIEQQIRTWDVTEPVIIDLLRRVPREEFVPAAYRALAWAETEIPLGDGRFMLYPMIEGRILQTLALEAEETVLEIGTGAGYLAACLAKLCRHVTSIDASQRLIDEARQRLNRYGVDNVTLQVHDALGDGPPAGEFDAIVVTASLPEMDLRLLDALKPGGRLFAVVGQPPVMEARLYARGGEADGSYRSLFETCMPAMPSATPPPPFTF